MTLKCSAGAKRVSQAMLAMLLLASMTVLQVSGAGVQITQRRQNGDGDDDGDGGSSGGSGQEQTLDMAGLEDSLKTGGADGLASMLAAMGSMKHSSASDLIPVTKDADGNSMYNFGAIGAPLPSPATQSAGLVAAIPQVEPAPLIEVTPPVTLPTVSNPSTGSISEAATPSGGAAAAIPQAARSFTKALPATERQDRAAEEVAEFRGLRGSNTPKDEGAVDTKTPSVPQLPSASATSVPKESAISEAGVQRVDKVFEKSGSPKPNNAMAAEEVAEPNAETETNDRVAVAPLESVSIASVPNNKASVESLRQGLTAIRDHINSLMKESDSMLFGSQIKMRTQAAEQSPTVQLAPESAGQQRWAEMLRRVSALEEEHTQLQQQVHAQSDHIQALETEEDKEKQQLNATVKENSVLRADANDDRKQMLLLEQQSKQLQADDTNVKKLLGSVEQENKHLQSVVKAKHKQHASIQKVGLPQKATRDKGHSKVSRKIAGRQGKHHQKSYCRKAAVH
jgi:hypothetical protein